MRVEVERIFHEVGYFDGLFVDTKCGERIFGQDGKDYQIFFAGFDAGEHNTPIWDKEITCPKCKI